MLLTLLDNLNNFVNKVNNIVPSFDIYCNTLRFFLVSNALFLVSFYII
jgi:hypothetical protein